MIICMKTEKKRCGQILGEKRAAYHDTEYGKIVTDDNKLFEQLCLAMLGANRSSEKAEKREAHRMLFFNFNIQRCAELPDDYLEEVAAQFGKGRNKVFAVRGNARCAIRAIADYESLFKFVYGFKQPERLLPALRKYGFRQMGEAEVTEFMKSVGIVLPPHNADCDLRSFA